jgi:superfamily II DNA or RNA helicase
MIMKLQIHNTVSNIIGPIGQYRETLRRALSYRIQGFQFSDAWKSGKWDGRRSFYWNGRFPTGLSSLVVETLQKLGESVEVEDRRRKPENGWGMGFYGERRDYQRVENECIEATRGIINFATGSGKTAVAARIIAKLDLPTLYIVPTKELLYQTAEELKRFLDLPIGIIGDGKMLTDEFITVATVQTLHRVLKDRNHKHREKIGVLTDRVDITFIDECHHLGADSFFKVAQAVPSYYKFGLTATAFRTDGAEILLQAATGRILVRVSPSDLIRRRVLARTTVAMVRVTYRSNLWSDPNVGWKETYEYGIVLNDHRNGEIVRIARDHLSEDRRVLVLVTRLEHGEILSSLLHPQAVFIHGSNSSEYREQVRNDFRDGRIRCVVATNIYDEGVDLPAVDVLILACGGKSPVKSLQRVGRVMRRAPDKEDALIVDFYDDFNTLLRKHSDERLRMYRTESEFEIVEM